MGILITTDNPFGAFELSAFGEQNPNNLQFIQSQYAGMSAVTDMAARSFMETSYDIYNRINGSEAMRSARAALGRIKTIFQSDTIRELTALYEMQHAPLKMQRWIMANPMARELYFKQAIDGYSETYIDVEPGIMGEAHYDYQLANDGIVKFTNDEGDWSATTYQIDLKDGDRFLELSEQVDIHTTWNRLENELRFGRYDPTSKYNHDL